MVAKTIMIQGTTSNAGKSILATALCKIFADQGLRVAPFKAWNMSQNSHVTRNGLELGVAQGLQAELLGLKVSGEYNPIFLKASGHGQTQLYVLGKPWDQPLQESFQDFAWPIIQGSLSCLMANYDVVVIEGAGSPGELNIKHREVANMRVAKLVDAPVLIVADVDRGGALAGIIGTIDLLESDERDLVIGSVLNKFRGDLEIMKPGCRVIEEYTRLPVVGVIPYCEDHGFPEEDGESLASFSKVDFFDFTDQVRASLDLEYIYEQVGVV